MSTLNGSVEKRAPPEWRCFFKKQLLSLTSIQVRAEDMVTETFVCVCVCYSKGKNKYVYTVVWCSSFALKRTLKQPHHLFTQSCHQSMDTYNRPFRSRNIQWNVLHFFSSSSSFFVVLLDLLWIVYSIKYNFIRCLVNHPPWKRKVRRI